MRVWRWSLIFALSASAAMAEQPVGASGQTDSGRQADQPATAPAAGQPASAPAVDEAAVTALVEQLGDPQYDRRQAAHKKLEAMGSQIAPVLARFRNHRDPEVAGRVRTLLETFNWMTRGALVVRVQPGTQAQRLDIHPGDVVMRVNDELIAAAREVGMVMPTRDRTLVLWREGAVITKKVAPGLIGIQLCDWSQARAGEDHALGLAAVHNRRFDEAAKKLQAARAAGVDDSWTLQLMAALAEYQFDHRQAMELYDLARMRPMNSVLSSFDQDALMNGLPFSSVQAATLLEQKRQEGDSEDVFREFEMFIRGAGRNTPLLAQLAAKDLPGADTNERHYTLMKLAMHRQDWKLALAEHKKIDGMGSHPESIPEAAMVQVQGGQLDAALFTAQALLGYAANENADLPIFSVAFVPPVLAAAAASGKDQCFQGLGRLNNDQREALLAGENRLAWLHQGVSPHVVEFLGAGGGRNTRRALLENLAILPEASLTKWAQVLDSLKADEPVEAWFKAWFLMRAGKYDQARTILAGLAVEKSLPGVPAALKAVELLSANSARLEKEWSALKGVVGVYDSAEKGALWAVRYDGRVFYLDATGAVSEPAGLSAGQAHDFLSGDCIRAWPGFATAEALRAEPGGTLCIRRSQIYLLEGQGTQRHWVKSYAADGSVRPAQDLLTDASAPAAIGYVSGNYPVQGAGRELLERKVGPGPWRLYWFNGDLGIAVNAETLKVIDLPREIARLLPPPGPKATTAASAPASLAPPHWGSVAIYRMRAVEKDSWGLIPTDRGLWTLSTDGAVARVPLAVEDPDHRQPGGLLHCSVLSWPDRPGKAYVGIAPQQGGQIFEFDLPSGKVRLMPGGFCGQGPDDSFQWTQPGKPGRTPVPCLYLIQSLYERRK